MFGSKKIIVPDKCPSCGSKRHWKKVAEPSGKPVQTSVVESAVNKLPPIPGMPPIAKTAKVAAKTANVATLGGASLAKKKAKKTATKLKGNAGTYYCKKCGLKITYE